MEPASPSVASVSGNVNNEVMSFFGDNEASSESGELSGSEYVPETDLEQSDVERFSENEEEMEDISDLTISNEDQVNTDTEINEPSPGTSDASMATPKILTRKRQRRPETWKANIRKKKCQRGEEYVSRRGKNVPAKKISSRKDCMKSCKFACFAAVTNTEREATFKAFNAMSPNEKLHYIGKTTRREVVHRPTTRNKPSRRKFSFFYHVYIGNEAIRVCKDFYLGTLAISQKPVYNYHSKKNLTTDTPPTDKRGKHPHKQFFAEARQTVIDHINSFPRVESHYCRALTKKEYLDSTLNLNIMYEMYEEKCKEKGNEPVKLSYYQTVFNNDFNLAFHVPKKDRCDLCEEKKIASSIGPVLPSLQTKYDTHIKEKTLMREHRQEERKDKTNLVICFDMENVITLPKAGTSSFFYKRKLNLYNMTAHTSCTGQGYCAIWTEVMGGRTGNDISSAVVKILERVTEDHPQAVRLTLWSDSCVPQNRNSHMSFAITDFLRNHPNIESIEMKFSVPGHSCIQEVDNMHSIIERAMLPAEFFSPVSFLKLLKKAKRRQPFKIIQMKPAHFKNYSMCAKQFKYSNVPYAKVSQLKFTQTHSTVSYKTTFAVGDWNTVSIRALEKKTRSTRGKVASPTPPTAVPLPVPKTELQVHTLPKAKQDDLEEMLKWMPKVDKEYYSTIMKKK